MAQQKLNEIYKTTYDTCNTAILQYVELNEKFTTEVKNLMEKLYDDLQFLTNYGFKFETNFSSENPYILIEKGSWTYNIRIPMLKETHIVCGYSIDTRSYADGHVNYSVYAYSNATHPKGPSYSACDIKTKCETVEEITEIIASHTAYIDNYKKING